MNENSLRKLMMYRFGKNESALLLLALTIAAAGLYTKFNNDIASVQYDEDLSFYSVVA